MSRQQSFLFGLGVSLAAALTCAGGFFLFFLAESEPDFYDYLWLEGFIVACLAAKGFRRALRTSRDDHERLLRGKSN